MTRRGVPTWPLVGASLAVLWVLVRGAEPTAEGLLGEVLVGLAVGLPLAYLFRRLYAPRVDPVRGVRALPYVVLYLVTFLQEIVVANLDVAYRALAPGPPLDPEVIYVPLRVESDLGITTIANSITITPGTLTLDHDPERNGLYVHVIDGRNVEQVVEPIRTWEDYALVIFDEDRRPEDPPGPVVITGGEVGGD